MDAIVGAIAISVVLIFILGAIFAVCVKNDETGPLFIVPFISAIAFGLFIMSCLYHETATIDSASVHQAIVLCETNGGLKTLDQRETVCENGVAFNTRSLKQPEKQ